MGAGIAMTFANAGIPVSVLELSGEALERGLSLVRSHYDGSAARGSPTRDRPQRAPALIQGATENPALGTADILIAAEIDRLNAKQHEFARPDPAERRHAHLPTS